MPLLSIATRKRYLLFILFTYARTRYIVGTKRRGRNSADKGSFSAVRGRNSAADPLLKGRNSAEKGRNSAAKGRNSALKGEKFCRRFFS